MLQRAHEEDFEAISLLNLPPDPLFVDVGANRGEAIHSILLKYKDNCKIIGFEPNPSVFTKLKSRYQGNSSIQLYNFGLGNAHSNYTLYIPYYRKWMFDGLASFNREEAAHWLESRLWLYREKHLSIRKEICLLKRMDDLNLQPHFIKIDVQGHELQVLKGAKATLQKHSPVLLIETIDEQSMQFLKQLGYKFYAYNDGRFTLGTGSLNTYCITDSDYCQLVNH